MKTVEIKFKDLRSQKDPYGEDLRKVFKGWVEVRNLPVDLNSEANVRSQKKTNAYKAVEESFVADFDQNFHLKNKGLTVTAHRVSYFKDPSTKSDCLRVVFTEMDIHGLIDGGHTHKVLIENRGDIPNGEDRYIHLEILTGLSREEIIDIIEARNTNQQVKEQSLANKRGQFDDIKKVLSSTTLADNIKYEEHDSGIEVRDLIALMYMFDTTRFSTSKKQPTEAFNRVSSCLSDYTKSCCTEDSPYNKLIEFLPQLISLADYINVNFSKAYNKSGGKFGLLNCGILRSDKKRYPLWFDLESTMEYKLPKGLLFPVLGAFRSIITEKDGQYKWVYDPYKIFDKLGAELTYRAIQTCMSYENKLTPTGKDVNLWRGLFDHVSLNTKLMMAGLQV